MQDKGRVLAFMAHPDDSEFLCAGTLARLREQGYQIHLATMTAGDGGSMELGPEEIAALRLGEAEKAARLLEGTYRCAGERDFQICYVPETMPSSWPRAPVPGCTRSRCSSWPTRSTRSRPAAWRRWSRRRPAAR